MQLSDLKKSSVGFTLLGTEASLIEVDKLYNLMPIDQS
jgi:hypothetical protein